MRSSTSRLSIVIVTYQSAATIGATLNTLWPVVEQGEGDVIVVDNASPDGTAALIAHQYAWVNLIENSTNVGFGRGCNRGIEASSTPYILLLNPDAVIDSQAITALLAFMDSHPRAGICGPAVVEASGALQPSGNLTTPWTILLKPLFPRLATRRQRHIAPGTPPAPTDWICGSVMLLRRKMINEIGAFDPNFFLYFEETDLCLRAQRAGWEIWTVGEAVATHINAASAKATKERMEGGTISEHYFRSRFYYLIKNFGWPAAIMAEIGEIPAIFFRAALARLQGKPYSYLKARLQSPFMKQPYQPADHPAKR